MPLCRPPLAALATLEFTWIYNDFLWALVLMNTGDKLPITSALNNLRGQFFTDNNLLAAGSVIVALPTVIVFFAAAEAVRLRPDAGRQQGLTSADAGGLVHLRAAGASLLLDARGPGPVTVPHWGPDLGELDGSTVDGLVAATVPAVPDRDARPAGAGRAAARVRDAATRAGRDCRGSRGGRAFSPLFRSPAVAERGPGRVVLTATDPDAGLALRTEVELAPAGLLRLRHVLTNTGSRAVPARRAGRRAAGAGPGRASCSTSPGTGAGSAARSGTRSRWAAGSGRTGAGRTGHDATVGCCAPARRVRLPAAARCWAVHVAWSGNHGHATPSARPRGAAVLGGGELLLPGEVVLAPGRGVRDAVAVRPRTAGRAGRHLAPRFHGWLRARPQHPRSPRPVMLNTWEAVYFDHDLDRLVGARRPRRRGRGRAVRARRRLVPAPPATTPPGSATGTSTRTSGRTGSARWSTTSADRGMQFGLWVEPEMVNPDSDLSRAHPDWILAIRGRLPVPARHQQVLDLGPPDGLGVPAGAARRAADRVRHRLPQVGPQPRPGRRRPGDRTARPAGRARPDARRLRAARRAAPAGIPDVEIESCASGGARVDLGILQRTDRVWTSDCNDALERQPIQRWTGVLLPPELLGAHVGADRSHTTGRAHDAVVPGRDRAVRPPGPGVGPGRRDRRRSGRRWRPGWRSSGTGGPCCTAARSSGPTGPTRSAWLHGVVGADRALYAFVQLATSALAGPEPARLPGLDPDRRYAVRPAYPAGAPERAGHALPAWLAAGGVELPGRVLAAVGLPMPVLHPEEAFLLTVTRT